MTQPLPHDPDIERIVLGTIMNERNALDEVRECLRPETFYNPFHQSIYQIILAIDARGDRPDMLTVGDELRKTAADAFDPYAFALVAGTSTPDLYQYAQILHEKEIRRNFFQIAQFLSANCFSGITDIDHVLAQGRQMLDDVGHSSAETITGIRQAVEGVYDRINLNLSDDGELTGFPTGFPDFDRQSGGLQRSDLVVIAAETSMGKTSLAISFVMNSGARVAFYSLEMKKEQIAARMMAIESGISASRILFRQLDSDQLKEVDEGATRVLTREIYFDDRSTANIDSILASIRMMKNKHAIDGAVVDYLQILNMNQRNTTKEQQMGEAARRLKNLAKELDIWIIALSQFNRDSHNPVPSLNRLRDSGQIAEAADVVALIYRPEVHERHYPEPFRNVATRATALIDIAKGRNIGLHKFICGFDKETTRFYPIDRSELPERMSTAKSMTEVEGLYEGY